MRRLIIIALIVFFLAASLGVWYWVTSPFRTARQFHRHLIDKNVAAADAMFEPRNVIRQFIPRVGHYEETIVFEPRGFDEILRRRCRFACVSSGPYQTNVFVYALNGDGKIRLVNAPPTLPSVDPNDPRYDAYWGDSYDYDRPWFPRNRR